MTGKIPFYHRFSNKLAFWTLSIFVLGQVLTLWAINQTSYNNANIVIEQSVNVAEAVFQKAYHDRSEMLSNSIEVLAADHGFKGAIASEDPGTIYSAMTNQLSRLNDADMMMLIDADYVIQLNTVDKSLNGKEATITELLDRADESEGDTLSASGVGKVAGKYMQLFVINPEQPDIWIVIGFAFNNKFTQDIRDLTLAEITLINTEQPTKLIASSLDENAKQELLQKHDPNMSTITLKEEQFLGKQFTLAKQYPQFVVIIQQSIDKQMEPYHDLERSLLVLFCLSLAGFTVSILVLARGIAKPVSLLTQATQQAERGNFNHSVKTSKNDEMGLLLRSFDKMMKGLSEKEQIRTLLGKVISPEIANELLNSGIELGGEEKEVTILFSDIRGFTKACEGEQPERILSLLNIYLTEVAAIIDEHNGVVDKFIGDAVMALFGAPVTGKQDPQNAVHSALHMCNMLTQLNVDLQARGYLELDIGIGINTGMVVAGNMGSENRLNYTVIGDNVNLSSRLEGLTKFYGVKVIVSETTFQQCPQIPFLFLDHVRVKGKKEPVKIYSPLSTPLNNIEQQEYETALTLYGNGQFDLAKQHFSALYHQHNRELYNQYARRCQSLLDNPPAHWTGVYTFTSK